MNDLLASLMAMIENLLILPIVWLFPIKWTVIIPGSSAVRFTFGKPGKELKPGVHFATTGQTLHKEHINTKLAIVESMYVLTEDGVPLRIRGVVIYKITSLVSYLTSTEDSDDFVVEAGEAAIRHGVSRVPFEDMVIDNDTVEKAISSKIAEICKEIGIRIKRYRFQDVEITDPMGRALSSIKAMAPNLAASATKMASSLSISNRDAVIVLSPHIQFVSNIVPTEYSDDPVDGEVTDES